MELPQLFEVLYIHEAMIPLDHPPDLRQFTSLGLTMDRVVRHGSDERGPDKQTIHL